MDGTMITDMDRLRYASFLTILILFALLLSARMMYLFLSDPHCFPVDTVKIVASYQHVTRKQIESVLTRYVDDSFIVFPVARLKADLAALEWAEHVQIERIWPGTLKITLAEYAPVAIWNEFLMTADGKVFNVGKEKVDSVLPRLSGPKQQQTEILQMYEKLSKLLSTYNLHASTLQLRDNQAWELSLTNGVLIRLGKRDLEKRLTRFCRAWPAVFADKPEQLSSVDLRYARGMAVQWKQQTGK
jgi:cell division protein FtsQ